MIAEFPWAYRPRRQRGSRAMVQCSDIDLAPHLVAVYADGCEAGAERCIDCPLEECVYGMDRVETNRNRHRLQAEAIVREYERLLARGEPSPRAAERAGAAFGKSARTVYRLTKQVRS